MGILPISMTRFVLLSTLASDDPHLSRKLQNALSTAQAAVFQDPFVRDIDCEASRNGVQEKDPKIIGIVLTQSKP